jgi:hypothetical protein
MSTTTHCHDGTRMPPNRSDPMDSLDTSIGRDCGACAYRDRAAPQVHCSPARCLVANGNLGRAPTFLFVNSFSKILSQIRLLENDFKKLTLTSVTLGFRKANQVHTYMHARIKFHAYSRHK